MNDVVKTFKVDEEFIRNIIIEEINKAKVTNYLNLLNSVNTRLIEYNTSKFSITRIIHSMIHRKDLVELEYTCNASPTTSRRIIRKLLFPKGVKFLS